MTKDEIIRMAEQAGFEIRTYEDGERIVQLDWYDGTGDLSRFAAIVAAAEREACEKVCDEYADYQSLNHDRQREIAAMECAEEIRARGKT